MISGWIISILEDIGYKENNIRSSNCRKYFKNYENCCIEIYIDTNEMIITYRQYKETQIIRRAKTINLDDIETIEIKPIDLSKEIISYSILIKFKKEKDICLYQI